MKKLLLILVLYILNSNVMAQWLAVASATGRVYYTNPKTIRKSDNKVKMWESDRLQFGSSSFC